MLWQDYFKFAPRTPKSAEILARERDPDQTMHLLCCCWWEIRHTCSPSLVGVQNLAEFGRPGDGSRELSCPARKAAATAQSFRKGPHRPQLAVLRSWHGAARLSRVALAAVVLPALLAMPARKLSKTIAVCRAYCSAAICQGHRSHP